MDKMTPLNELPIIDDFYVRRNKILRCSYTILKKCIINICSGLKFLHENDIIHLDIKPENILVKFKKRKGKIIPIFKICDFGISQILNHCGPKVFESTHMYGTSQYASPESIYYCYKNYTTATDIWGIGHIMYFMIYQKSVHKVIREKCPELMVAKMIGANEFMISIIKSRALTLLPYKLREFNKTNFNLNRYVLKNTIDSFVDKYKISDNVNDTILRNIKKSKIMKRQELCLLENVWSFDKHERPSAEKIIDRIKLWDEKN